jgi:hypothetical protein
MNNSLIAIIYFNNSISVVDYILIAILNIGNYIHPKSSLYGLFY